MQTNEKAAKWINQVKGLVTPPDICITIFEMVESQTATAKDLGDVISQDPNLSARLLKIVNSPFYQFSRKIDTVSRAIAVIGNRELSSLVLAVSAAKTFANIPNELVNINTFWRHSIYTALIARELAKLCNILHPERLFVAGIMHDIGSLIIYNRVPDIARALLVQSNGSEHVLYKLEQDMIDTTHAQIGGMLLESWMLPKILREAIAYHHEPLACETAPVEAAIIHIADIYANASLIGGFSAEPSPQEEIPAELWKVLQLEINTIDIETMMETVNEQFEEVNSLLQG